MSPYWIFLVLYTTVLATGLTEEEPCGGRVSGEGCALEPSSLSPLQTGAVEGRRRSATRGQPRTTRAPTWGEVAGSKPRRRPPSKRRSSRRKVHRHSTRVMNVKPATVLLPPVEAVPTQGLDPFIINTANQTEAAGRLRDEEDSSPPPPRQRQRSRWRQRTTTTPAPRSSPQSASSPEVSTFRERQSTPRYVSSSTTDRYSDSSTSPESWKDVSSSTSISWETRSQREPDKYPGNNEDWEMQRSRNANNLNPNWEDTKRKDEEFVSSTRPIGNWERHMVSTGNWESISQSREYPNNRIQESTAGPQPVYIPRSTETPGDWKDVRTNQSGDLDRTRKSDRLEVEYRSPNTLKSKQRENIPGSQDSLTPRGFGRWEWNPTSTEPSTSWDRQTTSKDSFSNLDGPKTFENVEKLSHYRESSTFPSHREDKFGRNSFVEKEFSSSSSLEWERASTRSSSDWEKPTRRIQTVFRERHDESTAPTAINPTNSPRHWGSSSSNSQNNWGNSPTNTLNSWVSHLTNTLSDWVRNPSDVQSNWASTPSDNVRSRENSPPKATSNWVSDPTSNPDKWVNSPSFTPPTNQSKDSSSWRNNPSNVPSNWPSNPTNAPIIRHSPIEPNNLASQRSVPNQGGNNPTIGSSSWTSYYSTSTPRSWEGSPTMRSTASNWNPTGTIISPRSWQSYTEGSRPLITVTLSSNLDEWTKPTTSSPPVQELYPEPKKFLLPPVSDQRDNYVDFALADEPNKTLLPSSTARTLDITRPNSENPFLKLEKEYNDIQKIVAYDLVTSTIPSKEVEAISTSKRHEEFRVTPSVPQHYMERWNESFFEGHLFQNNYKRQRNSSTSLLAPELASLGMKILTSKRAMEMLREYSFQNSSRPQHKEAFYNSENFKLDTAETGDFRRQAIENQVLAYEDTKEVSKETLKALKKTRKPFRICNGRQGYVSDPSSGCQVFYICLGRGAGEPMMCPNGTLFNQDFQVCDWWYNVECSQ